MEHRYSTQVKAKIKNILPMQDSEMELCHLEINYFISFFLIEMLNWHTKPDRIEICTN